MKTISLIILTSFQTRKTLLFIFRKQIKIFLMKSDDDMFDETTVLLTWNDMRVINDIILTSKYLL